MFWLSYLLILIIFSVFLFFFTSLSLSLLLLLSPSLSLSLSLSLCLCLLLSPSLSICLSLSLSLFYIFLKLCLSCSFFRNIQRESISRNAIDALLSYASTEPEPLSHHIPESIEAPQISSSLSSSSGISKPI